jgi:hypothetical protein
MPPLKRYAYSDRYIRELARRTEYFPDLGIKFEAVAALKHADVAHLAKSATSEQQKILSFFEDRRQFEIYQRAWLSRKTPSPVRKRILQGETPEDSFRQFAALGIKPEEISTTRHSDIEKIASDLYDEIESGSKRPGQQLFIDEVWEDQKKAIATAVSYFADSKRFSQCKQACLRRLKYGTVNAISAPIEEPCYFRDAWILDQEIPRLTQGDILKVDADFRKYIGPGDELGPFQQLLFLQSLRAVPKALAVLINPIRLKTLQKNWIDKHIVASPKIIPLKDRLQILIDNERRAIHRGDSRSHAPILAKILKENGLTAIGQNLIGLDLRSVDCSDVNFSGSNLSGAKLRRAKIVRAVFDTKTIINSRTRVENIVGADKAIGLRECLEANNRKFYFRTENPEAFTLLKRLPKDPGKNREPILSVTAEPAEPQPAQSHSAIQKKLPGKSDPKKTKPRYKKPDRGYGSEHAEALRQKAAAQLAKAPSTLATESVVPDPLDLEIDELVRSRESRQKERSLQADAIAEHRLGSGFEIDISASDDFFNELLANTASSSSPQKASGPKKVRDALPSPASRGRSGPLPRLGLG